MKSDMNDTRTPRERVGEALLLRTLEESRAEGCYDRPRVGVTRDGRTVTDCRGMRRMIPAPTCPDTGHCGGENGGWGLHDHPLAMAYAPLQLWREAYDPEMSLERGTMFAELDLPFKGDQMRGGGCNGR